MSNLMETIRKMSKLKFKDYDLNWVQPLSKIHYFIPKNIILHHALAEKCSMEDIHRWHIEKGYRGAGYNFLVRKDGTVEFGRPIGYYTAHTKGHNTDSIGICFEGNFDIETMGETQLRAGIELIKELTFFYNVNFDNVLPHSAFANKTCAGVNFPLIEMLTQAEKVETHWGQEHYNSLLDAGLEIHETRFDDYVTRAELFALIDRLKDLIKEDKI